MTEQGKDFFLLWFLNFFYQTGTLLIPFKIADRSKKTFFAAALQGKGGGLPFRKAAECDQLGNISVELTGQSHQHQQGCNMDTALVKAEADPKVNSYWYQAQDFSGTLGEAGPLLKSKS